MNLQQRLRDWFDDDEAVSPVIAVILMVAITVVLAATVYVWVSGFASEGSGPEQASATAEGAEVGGSDVNWVRVSLTRGENAPYDEGQVNYTVLDPSGNSFSADDSKDSTNNNFLCLEAKVSSGHCTDATEFHDAGSTDSNSWDVGEVLYVPCQESGDHSITISVKETTVLDTTVECDTSA